MIYLYAHTNFKKNLDSLKRVKVIYEFLTKNGKECEILVNDYRAQLMGSEWGLPLATTIETIKDIDAIAKMDDIVIIDSTEDIEGRVLTYPEKFKKVIYLNSTCKEVEFEGATIFNLFRDENIIGYNSQNSKNNKSIFIYGDSDYEKVVLNNLDKFKGLDLDLYWGVYFFVKYEDELKEVFNEIIESEDYYNIISSYSNIVTSSIQTAIDARLNGANVTFWNIKDLDSCKIDFLQNNGIEIVKDSITFGNNKLEIDLNWNKLLQEILFNV